MSELSDNELNSNIIIYLREYVDYLKQKIESQKYSLLDKLEKIRAHEKNHDEISSIFLKYDSNNHADLKIILDIYEDFLRTNKKYTFITLDKKIVSNIT